MDVIITTNSPGEVSAWVRPMVKVIKAEWPHCTITVVIPPCTFASGREVPVVESYPEVDRVISPGEYTQYALLRRKPVGFSPAEEGFVLFLGGDLGHATLLGERMDFPVYAYSERDAGHAEKIRLFFVPTERVGVRIQKKGVKPEQVRIVGDLMLDAVKPTLAKSKINKLLGLRSQDLVLNLFPGSRPNEVREGLPLFVNTALRMKKENPAIKPIVTLAPFITLNNVRTYLQRKKGLLWDLQEVSEELARLKVNGEEILIYRGSSYNTMQVTQLAISLPGTNNVELAAMEVPTLVVLPLNWPEAIPLPGVVGIVGQVPVLGKWLKRRVVIPKLRTKFPMVSPVNRTAGELIFPELVGILQEEEIARSAQTILASGLEQIRVKLTEHKKEEKASERIIALIRDDLLASLQNRHESS